MSDETTPREQMDDGDAAATPGAQHASQPSPDAGMVLLPGKRRAEADRVSRRGAAPTPTRKPAESAPATRLSKAGKAGKTPLKSKAVALPPVNPFEPDPRQLSFLSCLPPELPPAPQVREQLVSASTPRPRRRSAQAARVVTPQTPETESSPAPAVMIGPEDQAFAAYALRIGSDRAFALLAAVFEPYLES